MGEFNSPDSDFKHTAKFTALFQKSKKCLQISKCCHCYLWSQLHLQKASTYPKIFWDMVPQRLKTNSELQFFHIHLHPVAPHLFFFFFFWQGVERMDTHRKQIQLTKSSPGDAVSSTQVEGDGVTTAQCKPT